MVYHLMNTKHTTDYIAEWSRRVAERSAWRARDANALQGDRWRHRAAEFARSAPARSAARRCAVRLFEAVTEELHAPSILDIGAGAGIWSAFFARKGCRVTAIEPSPAMRTELDRACASFPAGQITVLPAQWPAVAVPPHDIVLCAHVMYGAADFRAWINAMNAAARTLCVVTLRAPAADDLFIRLSRIIGTDGAPPMPDAHLAIGALRQMGMEPHIFHEAQGAPRDEVFANTADMLEHVKKEFHMSPEHVTHDAALLECLQQSAATVPAGFTFPDRPRNAILLWQPAHATIDLQPCMHRLQEC
jgi:2-polyprenyl-3-methyl-5-hydroxy-6-metoxy-1,4-benzoquinol methylase